MLTDLDERLQAAVQDFWDDRKRQEQKQINKGTTDTGARAAVTGGTQMDALATLLGHILLTAGLGLESSHIKIGSKLELPGYYRPEKKWDLLVVVDGQLLIAFELKSHIGPSFGNNFNNRTEEAIGSAEDIWTAFREGRLGEHQAPLLGYFFLLEDCAKVHSPVRNAEPYFLVDPVLSMASYAKRYEILCNRLVLERKYDAACLVLSTREIPTRILFPCESLNFRQFVAAAEARVRRFLDSQ
jgi:hypothetical protein